MKIVILGAGRIGASLIRELLQENHEITVIDSKGRSCSVDINIILQGE